MNQIPNFLPPVDKYLVTFLISMPIFFVRLLKHPKHWLKEPHFLNTATAAILDYWYGPLGKNIDRQIWFQLGSPQYGNKSANFWNINLCNLIIIFMKIVLKLVVKYILGRQFSIVTKKRLSWRGINLRLSPSPTRLV